MPHTTRVAQPPAKPLLIFDGDCGFCRRAVGRLRQITGDRLDCFPFQDAQVAERFPELTEERLGHAVHLIALDGSVYAGAEATFRAVAVEKPWWFGCYENLPGFAPASEWTYRFVADHRTFFSTASRWLWGESLEHPSYVWVRWLFLRLIGLTYFIAFTSLWVQIHGLSGENGITPAAQIVQSAREQTAILGLDRFRVFPTLCWLSASDATLAFHCAAGTALSILLIIGVAPVFCLVLLWILYLSLVTVCPVFLAFQWDNLLSEVGLLAIFFAPFNLLPGLQRETPISRAALWLLRWLLFRLMLASGWVKLLSGDPTWQNLTALNFHYETQPLPTWIGWYAHQLPEWFQKSSLVLMFGTELLVPFLILFPRRLRLLAFWPLFALQLVIALTGNYGFFNLLTLALCVLLLDDTALLRIMPRKLRARIAQPGQARLSMRESLRRRDWFRFSHCGLVIGAAIVLFLLSLVPFLSAFRFRPNWLGPITQLYAWSAPFRSVNGYGLFAVMTTSRPEIIVQGSNDGQEWLDYEFKWKPGDLGQPPKFVQPHMPRLDWQMWFAALGTYRQNPWFVNFCVRLLQGTPEVLALIERNPFPNTPPKFVRAVVYDYHFTNLEQRRVNGQWWRREFKGEYCPAISLRAK